MWSVGSLVQTGGGRNADEAGDISKGWKYQGPENCC